MHTKSHIKLYLNKYQVFKILNISEGIQLVRNSCSIIIQTNFKLDLILRTAYYIAQLKILINSLVNICVFVFINQLQAIEVQAQRFLYQLFQLNKPRLRMEVQSQKPISKCKNQYQSN
ncbi:transmembrane protein, putative (macronuclear) [Tetrahymena thermophila SB210]|uniref:Transmembrane protein, putative n=1 Tax=Tetrahymena thermophila (strain SB210) TaxID=312017 RepID=X1W3T4_TETTS|nr:transmembrane protein, putative [Tetrahymena thermophila SB210]EDK31445.1 transmembrane protein, putative [Tetrahymena thermophila SB210]|eukprot:XP_001470968.1 transmembrane protein, putative [Tetrahymena thermophila SB210]